MLVPNTGITGLPNGRINGSPSDGITGLSNDRIMAYLMECE